MKGAAAEQKVQMLSLSSAEVKQRLHAQALDAQVHQLREKVKMT